MRRALTVLALGTLAACGTPGDPLAVDAALEPIDGAPAPDAGPPDVDVAWSMDLVEPASLDGLLVVPGGVVVLARPFVYWIDDDGTVGASIELDDVGSDVWGGRVSGDGDVVVNYSAYDDELRPAHRSRTVRLAAGSLAEVWSVDFPSIETFQRVVHVEAQDTYVLEERVGTPVLVHRIDLEGASTATELVGAPSNALGGFLPLDRGGLLCVRHEGGTVSRSLVDLAAATAAAGPSVATDVEFAWGSISANTLLITFRDRAGDRRIGAIDASGDEIIAPTAAGKLGSGAFERWDDQLLDLAVPELWVAPIADPSDQRAYRVPSRPGASVDKRQLASDGERVFAAWLDQLSTFDQVLRVVRIDPTSLEE